MSVPRQQPHALAKFKHQLRTSAPKPVTIPAHMVPYEYDWEKEWCGIGWGEPGYKSHISDSERKRRAARAARKSRK